MNKTSVWRPQLAVMLLPVLLLAACAAPLKPSTSVTCPKEQEIPALSESLQEPPSPESYLDIALKRIESWQKQLTDSATR